MGTAGRASGARPGNWRLSVIESADIENDQVRPRDGRLHTVTVEQTAWAEKQLLKPYDLLVTARSRAVKLALVPPGVTRTVASATLLVVRASDVSAGLPQFLWYYLTSRRGRALVEAQIRQGVTIPTLSASGLASIEIPVPDGPHLRTLTEFVAATTTAHDAALRAARLRHEVVREAVVAAIETEDGEAR